MIGEVDRGRKPAAKVDLVERRIWFRDGSHGGFEMEKEEMVVVLGWDWAEDGGIEMRRRRRRREKIEEKREEKLARNLIKEHRTEKGGGIVVQRRPRKLSNKNRMPIATTSVIEIDIRMQQHRDPMSSMNTKMVTMTKKKKKKLKKSGTKLS